MVNKSLHNLVIRDSNYEIVDASVRESMADEYSSSSTYSIGDLVLHNGQLYECSTAINTAEVWTVAHWTAVTVGGKISSLKTSLGGKLDEPSTAGTSGQVLTSDGQGGQSWQTPSGGGGGGSVSDVQINSTSILSNGVANIPLASQSDFGVAKTHTYYGTQIISPYGIVGVYSAEASDIKNGNTPYKPVVPGNQHQSVFFGLAKAAGDSTQSASSNAVGTYTDSAKTAIKSMLGVPNATYDLSTGTAITASADLNSYTTSGVYYADSTVISSVTHAPTTAVGYKLVVEGINENVIQQTVKTTSNVTYTRTGNNSTSSWVFSDWVANASYSLSISGNVITLTGSDGSTSSITLPVYNGSTASLQTWQGGSY